MRVKARLPAWPHSVVVSGFDISEVMTANGLDYGGLPGEGLHSEGVLEDLQHHHPAARFPYQDLFKVC